MTDAVAIRRARPTDAAVVLDLVREFADFDGRGERGEADLASVSTMLAGTPPAVDVVLAEARGAVAGFAATYATWSTALAKPGVWLEDLYVRPAFRGRGVGRALFRHVVAAAETRGCGRVEWTLGDGNAGAVAFYDAVGGTVRHGVRVGRYRCRTGSRNGPV